MLAILSCLLFFLPTFLFAAPPPIVPASPAPSGFVPLPVITPLAPPSYALPVPAASYPHIQQPFAVPIPPGRSASSPDAARIAAERFAADRLAHQASIMRRFAPVFMPFNTRLGVHSVVDGTSIFTRIYASPNPADLELVLERRVNGEIVDAKFISTAAANDAANLARMYQDALRLDPARMTPAQIAERDAFVRDFKAMQKAYRASWEQSMAGKASAPDPKKPYQQALFALNRVLEDAYARTKPGSDERAAMTKFLMNVADYAPIDSFISTYLTPKTGAQMLAEAADKAAADGITVVDASGEDGLDVAIRAIKDALGKGNNPDQKPDAQWSMTSELAFYGLEIRYLPSASARPGRDVQIVIADGPHRGRYMWLADYIRAGYPRSF